MRIWADLLAALGFKRFQGVHGVMQCQQHRRDALFGFLQQVLQIQQNGLRLVFVDEGRGNACLATSSCSPNSMHLQPFRLLLMPTSTLKVTCWSILKPIVSGIMFKKLYSCCTSEKWFDTTSMFQIRSCMEKSSRNSRSRLACRS